ncbi:MAG: DUF695 domain-containing protein [Flavobacteriaceae bacterium]|nr:DUF695 domain-containing protein [Flavobacteriaceae bacterium]
MLGKLFGKNNDTELKEDEVRIVLPEEQFTLVEYKEDDHPCIAAINSALIDFEHKDIFCWHLSVIIDFEDIVDNGMPSEEERQIVDPFCDKLDGEIKAGGNALFLARETWNETRRLVWMVYDPEIANQHLQYIIEYNMHPRPFDYEMKEDHNWEQAEWYLKPLRT